jgi:hypothetical protein
MSGVRKKDIDRERWLWTVRRQTTPGPGGLIDKGTKGERARTVRLIMEIRPLFTARLDKALTMMRVCSPARAVAGSQRRC